MKLLACLSLVTLLAACGDNSPANDLGADLSMSTGDMTASCDLAISAVNCTIMMSDKGNSKGVGAYCDQSHACPNNTICASSFFPGAQFCTIPSPCSCTTTGCVDMTTCGENTVCVFSQQFSAAGCVPAQCAPPTHC